MNTPLKPQLHKHIVMCRYLCKRSLVIGEPFYYDENDNKIERDNRMLVAGDWYDVVFNENESLNNFFKKIGIGDIKNG